MLFNKVTLMITKKTITIITNDDNDITDNDNKNL